jgi:hypothetical protein
VSFAEIPQLSSEIKGVLLAFAALDVGESGSFALADEDRTPCLEAWRALGRLDPDGRARYLANLRLEAESGLPAGFEELHPSWIEDALAGEPACLLEQIGESLPAALRLTVGAAFRGSATKASAERRNGALRRDVVRIAFAHLAPFCEGGGPLAARLSRLGLDALKDEITRIGARVLGRSLVGADAAVRARAMALAGEPWAKVIAQALGEEGVGEAGKAAARQVAANVDVTVHTAGERLLFIGLASLKEALQAESKSSAPRVAGRLPIVLGRRLL